MRAFGVSSFGEAPALLDLPAPMAGDRFLIRITYAGVNPIDYKLVEMLTASSKYPFILGIDFAGLVEHAPPGSHGIQVGDRVFGMARNHGTYAEYSSVSLDAPGETFARIPDGLSDALAAVLPVAGATALGSLHLLELKAGQSLAILGASGGVGGYAVQLARSRGAHVIATSHGDVGEIHRLGADKVFDATGGDVLDDIAAAYPEGIDAVLDLVSGADAVKRVAEIIKPGGGIVSTLRVVDEEWFKARQIAAHNIFAQVNPMASPEGLAELAAAVLAEQLEPRIRLEIGLDGAAKALERVRHGGLRGKAVVRI